MTAALPLSCAERLDGSATAPGRVSQNAPQGGPSFADLLQHGQAAHAAPSARAAKSAPVQADAAPPEPSAGEHADKPAETITPETPGKPFNAAARPSARARERAPVFAASTQDASKPAGTADLPLDAASTRRAADERRGTEPPALPALAQLHDWMASLQPPEAAATPPGLVATLHMAPAADVAAGAATAPAPVDGQGASRTADTATALAPSESRALLKVIDGRGLLRSTEGEPLAAPGAAQGLHLQRGSSERDDPRHGGADAAALPHGAQQPAPSAAPAALAAFERRPLAPELPAVRELVQGLLNGATSAVPRGFDVAPPPTLTLPAALHAPDFAQVLGAQVSVLARDGVQQAELHLHPAEMGPITVHIRIDDQDARVDFHADAAATREVIERGLPELASALREQGLTLAGGGVFQQAPDARSQADREAAFATGQPHRAALTPAKAPVRAVTLPVPQGTLDVYA